MRWGEKVRPYHEFIGSKYAQLPINLIAGNDFCMCVCLCVTRTDTFLLLNKRFARFDTQ